MFARRAWHDELVSPFVPPPGVPQINVMAVVPHVATVEDTVCCQLAAM